MKKETLNRLDKISLLWLFQKMSLGNLVRGIIFLTKQVEPVKKRVTSCVSATVKKVKTAVKKTKTEGKEPGSN